MQKRQILSSYFGDLIANIFILFPSDTSSSDMTGGIDPISGRAWTFFGSKIYVWKYKTEIMCEVPTSCSVLELPESLFQESNSNSNLNANSNSNSNLSINSNTNSSTNSLASRNFNLSASWIIQVVQTLPNETLPGGTSTVAMVALHKRTMASCYWPDVDKPNFPDSPLVTKGNMSWANGMRTAGPKNRNPDQVTSMLALEAPGGAVLLAGCSSGELWRVNFVEGKWGNAELEGHTWKKVQSTENSTPPGDFQVPVVRAMLALPPPPQLPAGAKILPPLSAADVAAELAYWDDLRGSKYRKQLKQRQLEENRARLERAHADVALALNAHSGGATWRILVLTAVGLEGWSLDPWEDGAGTVKIWYQEILQDKAVQAELATEKKVWLLGLALNPPSKTGQDPAKGSDSISVSIFVGSLGRERRAPIGSLHANYWILSFFLPRPFARVQGSTPKFAPNPGVVSSFSPKLPQFPQIWWKSRQDLNSDFKLERNGPMGTFFRGGRLEEEGFFLGLKFKSGGNPGNSFSILSRDGTASFFHTCPSNLGEAKGAQDFELYRIAPGVTAGKILAISGGTANHWLPAGISQEWTVLTEFGGVWGIPEEAIVSKGVEYEPSNKRVPAGSPSLLEAFFERFLEGGICQIVEMEEKFEGKNVGEMVESLSLKIVDSLGNEVGNERSLWGDLGERKELGESLKRKRKRHSEFLQFLESSRIQEKLGGKGKFSPP